jgi:hypothetical protein
VTADTDPAAPAGSPGAAGAIREEAARQLVALVGGAALVLVAVAVEKWATQPDAWRTTKMRAARAAEAGAMRVATAAAGVADAAHRVYRGECSP